MKCFFLAIFLFIGFSAFSQTKTIHVFVALCDNENQGIVPVSPTLGNGQDPKSNLYWGAMFGIKSFFRYKSENWIYQKSLGKIDAVVLERVLFKHRTKEVYLIADAYDGKYIKKCTEDFLLATNKQNASKLPFNEKELPIHGGADLIAYIGHDGLMNFDVSLDYVNRTEKGNDTMILACSSQEFFQKELLKSKATPVLWTTNLMAPEAYTLEASIEGWIADESGEKIHERASQAYNKYQKCGINGARRLFATGF